MASVAQPIEALVADEGTAAFAGALIRRDVPLRDLADAVHSLCAIHCQHPGVIDHANGRGPAAATAWLADAVAAFALERAYLAELTAAVGPIPSTPGQAEAELALATMRHTLDRLTHSDRAGCAFGAAAALVIDWHAIRQVLDRTGERLGVDAPHLRLPDRSATNAAITQVGDSPALARAAAFGAQQLVAQHRGLWQLLEARIVARQRA